MPHRHVARRTLAVALTTVAALLTTPSPVTGAVRGDRPWLTWPFTFTPQVTRPFIPPQHRYGSGHRGVDLAAAVGQRVLAPAGGVVVFAGMLAGRGVISIQHTGAVRTTYEPVRPSVAEGEHVHRGQVIGTLVAGHPGCPAVACLHWGVRRGEYTYLDPLSLLRAGPATAPIRLKPWNGLPT